MAFIKEEKIGLKRAPQCPFSRRGRGMQFFYTGYMAWCKAHNTYMGMYVKGAAEYHRGMQFFLYNMHLALHIRYATRCSRVSQGHEILFIQGTWHGAQCM